jgi:hypothetical protein
MVSNNFSGRSLSPVSATAPALLYLPPSMAVAGLRDISFILKVTPKTTGLCGRFFIFGT